MVAPDLTQSATAGGSEVARLTDSFHLNLTAFSLLSFAVGAFTVHGAIGLVFEQRRQMVRALEAPLGWLIALFAIDLAVLALLAGAMGLALRYVVAAALLPDAAATLRGLYVAGCRASLPCALRGGCQDWRWRALWSLARMSLLASVQPRAWVMARQSVGPVVLSVGLLALAGALALWGHELMTGVALLGALLIGGALALPPLLALVLRLGEARACADNPVVPGRHTPTTARTVAGIDGAFARYGGQCGRVDHGFVVSPNLCRNF
ncbi:MAG: hypothetical protein ACOH2H_24945 [Cypionkella sp.]